MRAVLDPNILISALLSRSGAPGELIARWLAGGFELVLSELLLDELARALAYPKLRARVAASDADEFVELLRATGAVAADPPKPARRSSDRGDDYLLALAESKRAILVSGDRHLLELADRFPVQTALGFLDSLVA
ncbi:MAG: putative toxin-antitoxin system toxin component, PIN family [Gaiellaceae bacterium]